MRTVRIARTSRRLLRGLPLQNCKRRLSRSLSLSLQKLYNVLPFGLIQLMQAGSSRRGRVCKTFVKKTSITSLILRLALWASALEKFFFQLRILAVLSGGPEFSRASGLVDCQQRRRRTWAFLAQNLLESKTINGFSCILAS